MWVDTTDIADRHLDDNIGVGISNLYLLLFVCVVICMFTHWYLVLFVFFHINIFCGWYLLRLTSFAFDIFCNWYLGTFCYCYILRLVSIVILFLAIYTFVVYNWSYCFKTHIPNIVCELLNLSWLCLSCSLLFILLCMKTLCKTNHTQQITIAKDTNWKYLYDNEIRKIRY